MTRTTTLLLLLWAYISPLQAQFLGTSPLQNTHQLYHKSEWDIRLKATWQNPHHEQQLRVDMQIVQPSGDTLYQPCYYVQGASGEEQLFKARFAPLQTGTHYYRFRLWQPQTEPQWTEAQSFQADSSARPGFLQPNNLWSFRYSNGRPFRGIGENICWESRSNDDSKFFKTLHEDPRFNYDFMLKKLASNGGNFYRVWSCTWNLPVDWPWVSNTQRYQHADSYYNESGSQRLDEVLHLSDSLGIHLMLAFSAHIDVMGESWQRSPYNIRNGGPAATPRDFFELPAARQQYKNKLRYFVARWGYSPAVGVWEFFNEVDNALFNQPDSLRVPAELATSWHREMSDYLRSIDPYRHLISTSISHRDIPGLNDLPAMDLNQKHIYKNVPAIPEVLQQYSAAHNKPYAIGEYGYEWDWEKNFNDFAPQMDNDFKLGLWLGLFAPSPILPMSWWWEFFEDRGLMAYFARIRTIHELMLAAGGGEFQSVSPSTGTAAAKVYSVRCGNSLFTFAYNPDSVPQTTAPVLPCALAGKAKVELFDCESGTFSPLKAAKVKKGSLQLPSTVLAPGQQLVWIHRF